MPAFLLPKLYPITDVWLSGLSHAEQVGRLAEGGATLIQLREKRAAAGEFYEAAVQAMRVARHLGVRIIINDRVDIAVAVGADGVHLGQNDLPIECARTLVGPGRIVGYSTHNLDQALAAEHSIADYIAIGPLFQTATKENPDPTVGLDLVRQLRSQLTKPIVGIGGVTLQTAAAVIESGADSVSVISDLFVTGDLRERTRQFQAIL